MELEVGAENCQPFIFTGAFQRTAQERMVAQDGLLLRGVRLQPGSTRGEGVTKGRIAMCCLM